MTVSQMAQVKDMSDRILAEASKVIVGKTKELKLIEACLFAGGHALLEGVPGVAKTSMAKALASSLGLQFNRIQFTPDLLPSDIVGTYIFDQKLSDFKIRKGPVFGNIILADEINRASPKTQSALLEAMQERQVTIEGTTLPLPSPFIVLATAEPHRVRRHLPSPGGADRQVPDEGADRLSHEGGDDADAEEPEGDHGGAGRSRRGREDAPGADTLGDVGREHR